MNLIMYNSMLKQSRAIKMLAFMQLARVGRVDCDERLEERCKSCCKGCWVLIVDMLVCEPAAARWGLEPRKYIVWPSATLPIGLGNMAGKPTLANCMNASILIALDCFSIELSMIRFTFYPPGCCSYWPTPPSVIAAGRRPTPPATGLASAAAGCAALAPATNARIGRPTKNISSFRLARGARHGSAVSLTVTWCTQSSRRPLRDYD